MNARRLFTVPLVVALLAAAPLHAHFAPLTPAELVERSGRIVVATVEEQSSRREGSSIYTDTLLRVEDRLRGAAPDRLTISQLGGSIGDETQGTCLSVPLEPGERYLLFLSGRDRPSITGGPQGAVRDRSEFSGIVEEVRAYLNGESPSLRAIAAAAAEEEGLSSIHDRFVLKEELAVPPIVFTPLPEDSPFSPHDQRQMAYWNVYHPDLFRVGPATGLWSSGNGVFEIGFPDRLGDRDWPTGGVSAIVWRTQDGHTVEADIGLNPAVSWTLDEEEATRPNEAHSFRETILSHLGQAWGMRSSVFPSQDSVVALKAKEYRLATLFADDTAAVRAAFGGTPVRDGLISSHYGYFPSRPSVSAVRRGGSFLLQSPIKIENPGTENLVNPQVEVYLVPRRFSMEKAALVGRVRVRGTILSGGVQRVVIGRVVVPRTVRPGVYHLAFRLVVAGDKLAANDIAWSNHNVTLTVKNR